MKISVHRKEMGKLKAAFPGVGTATIYRALKFETHTIRASRIRCYAMNHLKKTLLLKSAND